MAFTVTVTRGYDFPPDTAVSLDQWRAAALPSVTVTGSLSNADDVSGTAATVTGQAFVWNSTTGKWEPSGTIKVRNTDLGAMVGASASVDGTGGAVPTPLKANVAQFLRGDGQWADPASAFGAASNIFSLVTFY